VRTTAAAAQQQQQVMQQVMQQQQVVQQTVQVLVSDRLCPKASSTSTQLRNRCGCTGSAQFLSQGPQLDAMHVTQWWIGGFSQLRSSCNKRGRQTQNNGLSAASARLWLQGLP
jgi:hypothetical protein